MRATDSDHRRRVAGRPKNNFLFGFPLTWPLPQRGDAFEAKLFFGRPLPGGNPAACHTHYDAAEDTRSGHTGQPVAPIRG